jgi:hypothetical protein
MKVLNPPAGIAGGGHPLAFPARAVTGREHAGRWAAGPTG